MELTLEAHDREATATIRGYSYQFDATILHILSLRGNETLVVEGIEDFDIESVNLSQLFNASTTRHNAFTRPRGN